MASLFEDLQWRGLVQQTTEGAQQAIDGEPITFYAGFDPSADSLHVGSLLGLVMVRRFQEAGHRPIVLAGGATGLIGDPSFKATERRLLDDQTLQANIAGIERQMRAIIDFSPGKPNAAELVNNYDWTKNIGVIDFLRDTGKHFSVNQMIAKESVRARLTEREQGISFTEFSYSLLQAYDFLHLFRGHGCALQLGGVDQWGNIVAGVDLVRRSANTPVHAVCWPLVTKADGTKFGKTESGTVWLDPERTSPYQLHQFLLRSEDSVVDRYLKYFTFLSHEEIDSLAVATSEQPRERRAQHALADSVTTLVHGKDETERAKIIAKAFFGTEIADLDEQALLDVMDGASSVVLARSRLDAVPVVDVLVEAELVKSKAAARTAIEQGGASVNNRKVDSVDALVSGRDLLHGRYVVLRRGKKEFALVDFA